MSAGCGPKTAKEHPLFTFNANGACRVLEMVGKDVSIQAFKEVVENPNQPSRSQGINNTLQQFIFQPVKKGKKRGVRGGCSARL